MTAGQAQANVSPLKSTIQCTAASSSSFDEPAWAWPYRSLGDSRTYVLAPYGSFTGSVAPGWQLQGGARLATDSARGIGLALPAGASAISPGMCVDLDYPHLRFAHKVVGKNPAGVEIKTEVVYPQLSKTEWTEVTQFDGYQGQSVTGGWRITPDVDLKPEFGGQVPARATSRCASPL